jgi:hypothetical protein
VCARALAGDCGEGGREGRGGGAGEEVVMLRGRAVLQGEMGACGTGMGRGETEMPDRWPQRVSRRPRP